MRRNEYDASQAAKRLKVPAAAFRWARHTGLIPDPDGPDSWWAETVLAHGGRIEAVVPAAEYRAGLPDWHHPTYDRLLGLASDVHETGMTVSDAQAHMAGSEILVGLVDDLLAVWDGEPAWAYGGTADVVAYAERQGTAVRVLWPEGASR
ncbi:hypothetical protein [Streptomyces incanus]|uniref:Uncharacterized protein n=1 Tax=Streptomyces incanus TaxID=887453 RepID=A0ABW0XTJ7_9ACTN